MGKRKYAIGVGFGTESGRVVLADVSNGGFPKKQV
jgi:ribulose kinase